MPGLPTQPAVSAWLPIVWEENVSSHFRCASGSLKTSGNYISVHVSLLQNENFIFSHHT